MVCQQLLEPGLVDATDDLACLLLIPDGCEALKVLEDAGLVTCGWDAQRRPVHLEAEVFDLRRSGFERYRAQAEERFRRLDELLDRMATDEKTDVA